MSDHGDDADEAPKILRGLLLASPMEDPSRRAFMARVLGAAAVTALGGAAAGGCGSSDYQLRTNDAGQCTCHVVCTCDTVRGSGDRRESQYSDTGACTCNTVCTCNSQGSSGGGGGGGSTYYYPN
jgi:hypothetical protein